MSPPRAQVTDAFLHLLNDTGVATGDGATPTGHPQTDKPYAILYSIPGGMFDGPGWSDPHAEATAVYQVTSFGWQRDQAEQVADRLRSAALAGFSLPDGAVMGVEPDGGPGAAEPEGATFNVHERFRVTFTAL